MNLKQVVAHAFVRRIVYVIVAGVVAVGAGLFSGKAKAQAAPPVACNSQAQCDRGQAYAACDVVAAYNGSIYPTNTQECAEFAGYPNAVYCANVTPQGARNSCAVQSMFAFHACPASAPWDPITKRCALPDEICSSKPPLGAVSYAGDVGTCQDGCHYIVDISSSGKFRVVGAGTASVRSFAGAGVMVPSGDQCTASPTDVVSEFEPDKSVCTSTGASYKECIKPNGDHCVTGAKGSVLCWSPGETGQRAVEDGSLAASREKAPATPAISSNIKDPTPIANTTTTINGETYNTTTVNGSGNTGGQANTGTGGRTGNGTGTSDGTGQGTGDGDGEGDEGDGNAGAGLGELYEAGDDTAASVMSSFYDQASSAPVVQSVTNFMMVSGTGSCPAFNLPASAYWQAMTYSAHCEGTFLAFLQAMGWVVFGLASFAAVKIAVT